MTIARKHRLDDEIDDRDQAAYVRDVAGQEARARGYPTEREWNQMTTRRQQEILDEAESNEPNRAYLEEQVKNLYDVRDTINTLKKTEEHLSQLLRLYLEKHPDEKLIDGEHGIVAFLQSRNGPAPYDLVRIYKEEPHLFDRLQELGCLTVNAAAVKAQGANLAGVDAYKGFAAQTFALLVKKED